MKCNLRQLRAYADGQLAGMDSAAMEAHLAACPFCRDEVLLFRRQAAEAASLLATLDPAPNDVPSTEAALSRLRREIRTADVEAHPTPWRSVQMATRTIWSRKWRPALIGAACVAVLGGSLAIAPVRQAAADLLNVFRVRKFAVVAVDPSKMGTIEGLAEGLDQGLLGQPEFTREPGDPVEVTSTDQASALAGFDVLTPTELPDGSMLSEITIVSGPAARYEIDGAQAEVLLSALDIAEVDLPDGMLEFAADLGYVVDQRYTTGGGSLDIIQMPNPSIVLPEGIDPAVFGEAWLRVMGLNEDDAHRMAEAVDWTSTLVVPVPTELARYREVEVNGVMGLELDGQRGDLRAVSAIMWEKGDMAFAVIGYNVSPSSLAILADSLQ